MDMHNTLSESRMGITKYSHLPFIGTAVTGDSHPVLPSNPVCVCNLQQKLGKYIQLKINVQGHRSGMRTLMIKQH